MDGYGNVPYNVGPQDGAQLVYTSNNKDLWMVYKKLAWDYKPTYYLRGTTLYGSMYLLRKCLRYDLLTIL